MDDTEQSTSAEAVPAECALLGVLDADVRGYISQLGLSHLAWHPIDDATSDDVDLVFLITKYDDEQFSLKVGKDCGHSFMEADDEGWCGPVKWVKAWVKL